MVISSSSAYSRTRACPACRNPQSMVRKVVPRSIAAEVREIQGGAPTDRLVGAVAAAAAEPAGNERQGFQLVEKLLVEKRGVHWSAALNPSRLEPGEDVINDLLRSDSLRLPLKIEEGPVAEPLACRGFHVIEACIEPSLEQRVCFCGEH